MSTTKWFCPCLHSAAALHVTKGSQTRSADSRPPYLCSNWNQGFLDVKYIQNQHWNHNDLGWIGLAIEVVGESRVSISLPYTGSSTYMHIFKHIHYFWVFLFMPCSPYPKEPQEYAGACERQTGHDRVNPRNEGSPGRTYWGQGSSQSRLLAPSKPPRSH